MTRSVEEALAYAKAESERRSQDWTAYESIRRAILRLEAARNTAAARGDAADVGLIKHELRRLRLLYREAVKE